MPIVAHVVATIICRRCTLCVPPGSDMLHFFIIGGSSTQSPQNPLGLTLVAFFRIVIFILVSNQAAALDAVCASEMSADSKLRL
jgi:hypothetical protein